jgi:hypothetical protein
MKSINELRVGESIICVSRCEGGKQIEVPVVGKLRYVTSFSYAGSFGKFTIGFSDGNLLSFVIGEVTCTETGFIIKRSDGLELEYVAG